MDTIRIKDLYKIFGPHPKQALEPLRQGVHRDEVYRETGQFGAVNAVDLEIASGQLFVVMGLSGSGKSTLVRVINRLLEPTAGTVEIDGEDIATYDAKQLRKLRSNRVSMVFQNFGLFPHRDVLSNVGYGLKVQGVDDAERRERAMNAIQQVGLDGWEERYPRQLSGGMRQRVGLARALATDADILLMDEPFSALDPLIRRDMQRQLLDLQVDLQKTIVFITHDLNEAMLLGDRIAVMKDGYIVQNDPPETILKHPANSYVAEFVQDVDRSRVLTAESVMIDPLRTITSKHAPDVAVLMMREHHSTSLYVVDQHRRLTGVVTDEDLTGPRARSATRVGELAHENHPRAERDTLLSDLLYDASQSAIPTAVLDDGQLVGIVPRSVLLTALSTEGGEAVDDGSDDGDEDGDLAAGSGAAGSSTDGDPSRPAADVTSSDAGPDDIGATRGDHDA